MILSYSKKFLFIKTMKTAGTSIEVFLSPRCGPGDVVTPIYPPEPGHVPRNHEGFYNHMAAAEIRDRVPPLLWAGLHKFCVVRNPWDAVVSFYHWQNREKTGADRPSLEQFLAAGEWPLAHELYTDPADPSRLLADDVLRYESLDSELARTFARLGIPFGGRLEVFAKAQARTDRRPYREWYAPRLRDLVAARYAREIELFGYSF